MNDHEKEIENLKLLIDILRAERDEARQQLKEAKARNTMYLSKIQEYEAREQ